MGDKQIRQWKNRSDCHNKKTEYKKWKGNNQKPVEASFDNEKFSQDYQYIDHI